MIGCTCPLPAALPALAAVACAQNLGQIQKVIFQRVASTPFADEAAIETLANWTAAMAASDDEHVLGSPLFENFMIPTPEAVTEGGNTNETLDGQQIVVGNGFITATGRFRSLPAANLVELKGLQCEADVPNNLGVYFVNELGQIIYNNTSSTLATVFPITSLYVADPDSKGKNTHDFTLFQFNMKYGWADNLKVADPTDFNALTDIL